MNNVIQNNGFSHFSNFFYVTTRYPEIPSDEIKKVCPACRGICNCQICLQGDNLIKVIDLLINFSYLYRARYQSSHTHASVFLYSAFFFYL